MTCLKTIVVDDEPLARRLMVSFLEEIADIDVVAECANGREAIDKVLELAPDLMFLDIMMPGLNGFEVIKKLQPELLPMVIFCTAFERYALDAFEVHAVDYIVKPLDQQRLQLAVKRAQARFQEEMHSGTSKSALLGAIDDISSKVSEREPLGEKADSIAALAGLEKKITIKDRDSIKLIKVGNIAWIDAAGDYMCVHHRSTIVNLRFIEEVIPHTKGEYFLRIENGEKIKVSRNYRDSIKSFLSSMDQI
jgi:two-component system LytT family response regulator